MISPQELQACGTPNTAGEPKKGKQKWNDDGPPWESLLPFHLMFNLGFPPSRDDDVRRGLVLVVDRVHLELTSLAEHVLCTEAASDAAEHNTIKERVASETVVSMDSTCCLARNVQARDGLAVADALALDRALQASHAVVDHRCDDRNVELLSCNLGTINDVVIELLAAAGFA